MKILIVLPNDSLGGAEQYLKMIASYYSNKKNNNGEVHIYFFKNNNSKKWNDLLPDVQLHYMSNKSEAIGVLLFIKTILFKRMEFDYIYTSHIYTNALLSFLRKVKLIKSKRLVSRESTSIFLRYKGPKLWRYKLIYFFGYSNIDLLICQTERMKDQLEKNFKTLLRKVDVRVIANPIDQEKIAKIASNLSDPTPQFPYVVAAGRLIEVKGFDLLIKAFSQLKIKYPHLDLIILGKGPHRDSLISLASSLNIGKNVHFPGHVDNVYKYFKDARLCVVSSRIEGFPNVLLQMMSQNNNIVSTTCAGGINSIKGICTCKPDSVSDLFKAMDACLGNENFKNRVLFDEFLRHRDIKIFIKTIEEAFNNGNIISNEDNH